jgi:hypothetical protein
VRIIQIATAMNGDEEVLYAVGEDGVLYMRKYVSKKAPTAENVYAFEWTYYWEPQSYPVGMPQQFTQPS